jgi:hypothetical protein
MTQDIFPSFQVAAASAGYRPKTCTADSGPATSTRQVAA